MTDGREMTAGAGLKILENEKVAVVEFMELWKFLAYGPDYVGIVFIQRGDKCGLVGG